MPKKRDRSAMNAAPPTANRPVCPRCQETSAVHKNGMRQLQSGDRVQEYECSECGAKFCDRTGTELERARMSDAQWERASSLRRRGVTARAAAREVGCSHASILRREKKEKSRLGVVPQTGVNEPQRAQFIGKSGGPMEYHNKTAYIFIKTKTNCAKQTYETLRNADFVIGAWMVTGDYDLIAWVKATNEDDLYNYATTIRGYKGVELTTSHFVHNGQVKDWNTYESPNGVWVRLRGETVDGVTKNLNDNPTVGGWANIPGEYDYLVWTNGKTLNDAMQNVLHLTDKANYRTCTHVPLCGHFNKTTQQTTF